MIKLEFETYQDVRTMLVKWSIPIWGVFLYLCYLLIIPKELKEFVSNQFPQFAEWIKNVTSIVAFITITFIFSYIMINLLQIHDKYYDRYCVKWRYNYAITYLIPTLLRPIYDPIPEIVLISIKKNLGNFMENCYYYFVGDREMKIRKNLVVRFYESITKYWLSQIGEIAAIIFLSLLIVYFICSLFASNISFTKSHIIAAIIASIILGLFKILSTRLRKAATIKTKDQIDDIHKRFMNDLQNQFTSFCKEHNVQN
jgi:uncharacterized membrane protein